MPPPLRVDNANLIDQWSDGIRQFHKSQMLELAPEIQGSITNGPSLIQRLPIAHFQTRFCPLPDKYIEGWERMEDFSFFKEQVPLVAKMPANLDGQGAIHRLSPVCNPPSLPRVPRTNEFPWLSKT